MKSDFLIPFLFQFLIFTLPISLWGKGVTRSGSSGLIAVPTTEILIPGDSNAALHLHFFESDPQISLKGCFGYSEKGEIAIGRNFSSRDRRDYDVVFSPKYLIRENIAVGGILDLTPGFQDSLYVITGLPKNRVFIGGGINFGDSIDRFAHLGGYEESGILKRGFFLFGAEMVVDPKTKAILDYDGNQFSVGVRHKIDSQWWVDGGFNTREYSKNRNLFYLGIQVTP